LEATLFSSNRFVSAVVRALPRVEPVAIPVPSDDEMFGLQQPARFGRRHISLSAFGLWAAPPHAPARRDLACLVSPLKSLPTISLGWNVRHDQAELAAGLADCGFSAATLSTHILRLSRSFDADFANFGATARNLVRRAERSPLEVRRGHSESDVSLFVSLYERAIERKGPWSGVYPRSVFDELIALEGDVYLLVAELAGRAVGAAWFIVDGASLLYWQSAISREHKALNPSYALVSEGIRLAHALGLTSVNLGSSLGARSVEQFKEHWGAVKAPYWSFHWENPLWKAAALAKRSLGLAR